MWLPDSGKDRDRDRRPRSRQRHQGQGDDRQGERIAQGVTVLAAAAALAVLWPIVAVMAVTVAAAWATGTHHARILRAALWSASMTGAYAVAATVQDRPWTPGRLGQWARQPYADWKRSTTGLAHGHVPAALLTVAPVAVPAGLAIGAGLWAWRCRQMASGLAGRTALASVAWDGRQWTRQARHARADAAAPGRVPLLTRTGVPVGTVIRAVQAPWSRVLSVPLAAIARHMVVVGTTGSGKTVLMTRLWCGWLAAAQRETARHGTPPPLLVIIDGKGGPDARATAGTVQAALAAAGATRLARWPDDAALSLWDIPPASLAVLLDQLIEHGDGAAAYYADAMAAAVRLAVNAPQGPPRSAAEFLDRLSGGWLERAYAMGRPADLEKVAAARPHLPGIAMRYSVLLDRLGPALDGPGHLTDADAWYCALEGTSEASVAEAQGMAIIELVARAAASQAGQRRTILLALDEFSAISRRVPLSNLYERGRSLGLAVQVSAQSWEGLGRDKDERRRITATADGGIWLLRTPAPEPLVSLAGTRRVLEGSRKTLGAGRTGDEGSSRVAHTWVVDPDRIRQLGTGQAAWIRHGAATFAQIAPVTTGRPGRHRRTEGARGPQTRAAGTAPEPAQAAPAPPAGHPHQDQDTDTIPRIPRQRPPADDLSSPDL
jgi:hypothetical protein